MRPTIALHHATGSASDLTDDTLAYHLMAAERRALRSAWTPTGRDLAAIDRGIARCGVNGRSGPCAVYDSVGVR